MAKKKKSTKQHARSSVKPNSPYDEEDGDSSAIDVQSLCSTVFSSRDSSCGNQEDTGYSEDSESSLNDGPDYDDFEEKLDALLDGLHLDRKGAAKTRLGQLMALSKAMASRFCADYFSER